MASGKVGLGVTIITLGGVTVVGGLAGTLAAALAGLFAPNLLVPPDYAQAGLPLIPVPGKANQLPGPGEVPTNVPGAIPIGPGEPGPGVLGPGGGGVPELPSGPIPIELPPVA